MPVLKQDDIFAGRYHLSKLLGEGGFSEVWKANDLMADDAVVAIKIYAPNKGLDDFGLKQFRNEFTLTHALSHPHLLRVHHYDIVEGSPYLIMPFCPYGSLTTVLQQQGGFSERQVALVMSQIGAALEEIHGQEAPIIHQDIKPDNILLLQPDYFMLADFGISNRIRHTIQLDADGHQTLTVAYAAPERFDRQPRSETASDIFSLGVTLYEMCTKTVPWEGAGGQCLLKGAAVPALPSRYSEALNEILEACMQPDPAKRPTAAELRRRGQQYLETGQWGTLVVKGGQTRKKGVVLFLVAATVALMAAAGVWLYQGGAATPAATPGTLSTTSAAEKGGADPLQDKLKTVEAELVKANAQLSLQDSINQARTAQAAAPAQEKPAEGPTPAERAAALRQELQRSLNRISDPANSRALRSGWKQEALARFADGSARVVDASGGGQTEYRASIFLTLLLSSPHQVQVQEVKMDQDNKITEIRVTKDPLTARL